MFYYINENEQTLDETLKYDIKDLQELRNDGSKYASGYLKFSVKDDKGNEATFYTNGMGEGKFYYDKKRGNYVQSKGTAQFSVKNWSDAKMRKYLKSELENVVESQNEENLKLFFA